jgi:hypothetical protein
MVRPAHFGFNPETAENNAFQVNDESMTPEEISNKARAEFDSLAEKLQNAGVELMIIEDTDQPLKTDAVFPNNWFSTHAHGSVILYPMYSPNRRLERREDIIEKIESYFEVNDQTDYLEYEDQNIFVEGTGSMILDRPNQKIYACVSERSHPELLERIASDFQSELFAFEATDKNGVPYYHTNVIMALGTQVGVICLESIEDVSARDRIVQSLQSDGKEILNISRDQVEQFAGNMLEVKGEGEKNYMVMSTCAYKSLTPSQVSILEKSLIILHSDLSTIEKYGGGSARCMLAEIYLKKK